MRRAEPPRLAIALSTLAALLLAVCPMPPWLLPARPDWLSLLVIFWILRAPQHVGMGSAWVAGLVLDALCGGVLGPRALAMAVLAYVVLVLRPRMLHYTLVQQMGAVAGLSAVSQFLCRWAQGLAGTEAVHPWLLAGSLTAAFCWPIVSLQVGSRGRMETWDAAA